VERNTRELCALSLYYSYLCVLSAMVHQCSGLRDRFTRRSRMFENSWGKIRLVETIGFPREQLRNKPRFTSNSRSQTDVQKICSKCRTKAKLWKSRSKGPQPENPTNSNRTSSWDTFNCYCII